MKKIFVLILFMTFCHTLFCQVSNPKNLPIDSISGCPLMIYFDEFGFMYLSLHPYNDDMLHCIKEDSLGNCIATNKIYYPASILNPPPRTPDYVLSKEDYERIDSICLEYNDNILRGLTDKDFERVDSIFNSYKNK